MEIGALHQLENSLFLVEKSERGFIATISKLSVSNLGTD